MTQVINDNIQDIKEARVKAVALLRKLKVGDLLEQGHGVCRELVNHHDYIRRDIRVYGLYGAIAGILFDENDDWRHRFSYFPNIGVFTEQRRQFTRAIANTPSEILDHLIDRYKADGLPPALNTNGYSIEQVKDLQRAAQFLLKSKPTLGSRLEGNCGVCMELRPSAEHWLIPYDLFSAVSPHLYKGVEALPEYGVWTKQRLHLLRVYVKTPARILTHLVNERGITPA